jgi:hypothetical protein
VVRIKQATNFLFIEVELSRKCGLAHAGLAQSKRQRRLRRHDWWNADDDRVCILPHRRGVRKLLASPDPGCKDLLEGVGGLLDCVSPILALGQ